MARKHPARVPAAEGALILPAELAIYREAEWPSFRDYNHAESAWFRNHGIDPADWSAVHPILVRSKRDHAVLVRDLPAQDRARRRAEGAGPNDPAQPRDASASGTVGP